MGGRLNARGGDIFLKNQNGSMDREERCTDICNSYLLAGVRLDLYSPLCIFVINDFYFMLKGVCVCVCVCVRVCVRVCGWV